VKSWRSMKRDNFRSRRYKGFDRGPHRGLLRFRPTGAGWLRNLSLIERRSLLPQKLFDRNREPVRLSEAFEVSIGRLVKAVRGQGLEDIVAKRADSRYEAGRRSGAWIKFKTNQGQELVIGGYKPINSSFEYRLAGYYEGTKLFFVGRLRTASSPHYKWRLANDFKNCRVTSVPSPISCRRRPLEPETSAARARQKSPPSYYRLNTGRLTPRLSQESEYETD